MLSRIAESLFWIGRYVERADDTARILDVHLQLLLEDPWVDEAQACRDAALRHGHAGRPPERGRPGRRARLLAYDAATPSSIVGALGAARENARRARETVSTELWETLNTTWHRHRVRRAGSRHDGAPFFAWVRERAALVTGIADATMSRDDAWQFLVLGRSIERADMTARLVATARSRRARPRGRRCCAPAAPTRRSCAPTAAWPQTSGPAEFLLLDRLFPRSVLYALSQAEECLDELGARGRAGRRQRPGPAGARPDPHQPGVPLPRRGARRPARGDGAGAARLLGGQRRGRPALLPARGDHGLDGRSRERRVIRHPTAPGGAPHRVPLRRPGRLRRTTRRG